MSLMAARSILRNGKKKSPVGAAEIVNGGRFEARIKLPTGQGTWPAFWMLPSDEVYGGWPLSGEIDIMETVNLGAACTECGSSTIENRSSGTLHFGSAWPNNTFKGDENPLPGTFDDYYVFAAEWGEGQISVIPIGNADRLGQSISVRL